MQACGARYSILEENIDVTDVDDVVVALVNMAKRVSFASTELHSLYICLVNETILFNSQEYVGSCMGMFLWPPQTSLKLMKLNIFC